jgi:Domain of unknown function (DUF6265)
MRNGRLSAVLTIVAALAVEVVAQQPQGIQRVAWLRGCWEMSTPDRTVEEQWMVPRGGSMMGMSRTVRDGKLVAYEMVLIREERPALAYEAHPSGQPVATFLSTTISPSQVVFENPSHDFPQQIGYQLKEDALLAWIAGSQSGKSRRVEFSYKRVTCGGR